MFAGPDTAGGIAGPEPSDNVDRTLTVSLDVNPAGGWDGTTNFGTVTWFDSVLGVIGSSTYTSDENFRAILSQRLIVPAGRSVLCHFRNSIPWCQNRVAGCWRFWACCRSASSAGDAGDGSDSRQSEPSEPRPVATRLGRVSHALSPLVWRSNVPSAPYLLRETPKTTILCDLADCFRSMWASSIRKLHFGTRVGGVDVIGFDERNPRTGSNDTKHFSLP
jgi:hypothetical protein